MEVIGRVDISGSTFNANVGTETDGGAIHLPGSFDYKLRQFSHALPPIGGPVERR